MKYVMKRNEWTSFIRELISRCYEGKASWKEFQEAEVEYIPLDLSDFPQILPKTEEWLNNLFTEETADRNGNYMLKAHADFPYAEMKLLDIGLMDGDGVSMWGCDDDQMLIYSYTEGDSFCTLFADKGKYETEKAETARWWKEERGW